MKTGLILLAILLIAIGLFVLWRSKAPASTEVTSEAVIRYVAIGDSYTIGEGARADQAWPNLLTDHLRRDGVDVALVANPSVTGWTTQQAIDRELPVFEHANPNFATVLIGVNDWVQGVDRETFGQRFATLLDRMLSRLPSPDRLVVVTIPDFAHTPTGRQFAAGRNISAGLAEFNTVIKAEAAQRRLKVVDIFPLSQTAAGRSDLIAADGLHPSAAEYARWEELIYPVAKAALPSSTPQPRQ